MNWHEPTQEEIDGSGDNAFLVDITPDAIPHQVAQDGDALLRISRTGWSWILKDLRPRGRKEKRPYLHMGWNDTREAAIGEVLAKLAELRA